jgi:hypothetical protein
MQPTISNSGLEIQFSSYPVNPVVGGTTYFKINFNKPDIDYTFSITQQGSPVFSTLSHATQGTANIPFRFQTSGTYQVTVEANELESQPMQSTTTTFSVTVISTSSNLVSTSSTTSTTSITVTPNSASYVSGQSLTFTALVTDTSNSPTTPIGTVSWSDGNDGGSFSSSACTLSSGTCTISYTPYSSSSNSVTITASYGGDSTHQTSSGISQLSHTQDTTSILIVSSASTISSGEQVTVTTTVTDPTNSQNIPTGIVTWSDGNAGGTFSASTCDLSSGTCVVTYTASSNVLNSIVIAATYGGDSNHPSISGTSTLMSNSGSSTSSSLVTISPNPASYVAGTAVTFTATVIDPIDSLNVPTGTVIWSDGNAGGTFSASTCDLSSGTCVVTYTASSNAQNSITITASYYGDTGHAANSATSLLTNSGSSTSSSLVTISPNPASYVAGTAVTFTATVADPINSQNIPTGTMIWSDGNAGGTFSSSTCILVSGTCVVSYTPSTNPPSAITITASYGGDTMHQPNTGLSQLSANVVSTSTSTTSTTTGLHPTTATIIPNPATFSVGTKVTFAVTVTDTTNPSSSMIGLVQWTDNGAGGSFSSDACILTSDTCSLQYAPPLNPSNSVTITAFYAGDSAHSGSAATSTLSVNGISSSLSTTQSVLATPQEIQSINQAKANQTIAAEVNVGTNQSTTTSIDNNVSVQTINTTPNSLNVNVTAPSQTGPKVISFNLNATTINVANLKQLGVMYDGQLIQPASNMDAILHAKSTDNPSFAIVVTQGGVQVLVLIPHFSTHSITIMNMSEIMVPTVPEFGPIVGVVIMISIVGSIMISRRFIQVW